MIKIAITGGISSGKTTASQLFAEKEAYVVDADKIVHSILSSQSEISQKVIDLLGPNIVTSNQIDRNKVAKEVFSKPDLLSSLEELIHPEVFHQIRSIYQKILNDNQHNLFVVEIPLLYETDSADFFDYVIVVLADRNLCLKRFYDKTSESQEAYDMRMQRQMNPKQKAAKADFILINNDDIQNLDKQISNILTNICST